MDQHCLILLAFTIISVSAWSAPFYPVHRYPHQPVRVTRYAPHPPHRIPIPVHHEEPKWQRPKRDHDEYDDHSHEKDTSGVTGPVHTFVKTDKNANYKWGVRHHVGNKYAP